MSVGIDPGTPIEEAGIETAHWHGGARALLTYWQGIHPPEGLPGRQHFDPTAVWRLLPNLALVDVRWSPLRFRYRLLDTRLDAMIGKSLTGRWLDEAYATESDSSAIIGQ